MEILGYVLSLIMGITLGLFGGGGSILTVPILVYVFAIDPVLSTAYSLFVVGSSSAVGAFFKLRKGEVKIKLSLMFAIPSVIAVYAVRRFLVPMIPEQFHLVGFDFSKDLFIMSFFGVVMLIAALSMLRPKEKLRSSNEKHWGYVAIDGIVVGSITGFIGAGGGFLIVPALVLLLGFDIKKAVASSLFIISLKSLVGFLGDLGAEQTIDWAFLFLFTSIAIGGLFVGMRIGHYIVADKLKKGFAGFILIMAIMIFIMEYWMK